VKFLDANPFIYAYYKPRKKLTEYERKLKENAKQIIARINRGEEKVVTTVVHVSEIVNILKHGMTFEELYEVILGLFSLENVKILRVGREDYLAAVELSLELKLDPNDALAIQVMYAMDINEIYSFDTDFDGVSGIVRLPRL